MKPKEFDELVKQVFDQNDFEYNPANWDRLATRMDNKPGKSRHIFWIPLAVLGTITSVAASIAMIITLPAFLQHKNNSTPLAHITEHPSLQINTIDQAHDLKDDNTAINYASVQPAAPSASSFAINNNNKPQSLIPGIAAVKEETFGIQMSEDQPVQLQRKKTTTWPLALNTFNASYADKEVHKVNYAKKIPDYDGFRPDNNERDNAQKTQISISSGVNYGSAMSGYAICASGKRMLGEKFYLEGDIAFVSNTATERSNNGYSSGQKSNYRNYSSGPSGTQNAALSDANPAEQYYTSAPPPPPSASSSGPGLAFASARKINSSMRVAGDNSTYTPPVDKIQEMNTTIPAPLASDIREDNYNLYYAQFTPSVGYHVNKLFSVGIGGDFQRLLMDGKSASTTDNTGAVKEIPSMDIGLIGKSEMSINKKIKAGLCYRQGFNNIINGGNRYVDRTYLQVQLKYMIFKK